jgi:hypothetical protein
VLVFLILPCSRMCSLFEGAQRAGIAMGTWSRSRMGEKGAGRSVGGSPSRLRGVWLWRVFGGEGRGGTWWWWCDGTVCAPRPGCCLERCCLRMLLEFTLELIPAEQHVMEGTSCGTVYFLVPLLTCFNGEMSTTFLSQILRFWLQM